MKSFGRILTLVALALAPLFVATAADAAGGTKELKHNHWHFQGFTGTYDADAMQRGFQVYQTVCSSCHSLDQISFRNLGDPGGPFYLATCPEGVAEGTDCSNPNENPIVKAIAASYQITDGPDDTGDMFQRPGLPSDRIPGPYANEQQARFANSGAFPPDLSLIIKARHHGPDYVYSLLSGYEDAPSMMEMSVGKYYNPYFPGDTMAFVKKEFLNEDGTLIEGEHAPIGGVIAMSPPLFEGMIEFANPETPQTVDQYAKDVAEFLTWASEPKMEVRKKTGAITVGYLIILSLILYFSYREIWSRIH